MLGHAYTGNPGHTHGGTVAEEPLRKEADVLYDPFSPQRTVVRTACREDGRTILLTRGDFSDYDPSELRLRFDGKLYAFHRADPTTGDTVFYPAD